MTDLANKLRIKKGHRVLVLGKPRDVAVAAAGATVAASGRGPFDVVLAFVRDSAALAASVERACAAVAPSGAMWFAYPKASSGVTTDLTRDRGWAPVTSRGLVTVAAIAIDDTWSAVRVRPRADVKVRARPASRGASAPPRDLLAALTDAARATWKTLAPSHVREYVTWIEDAKKPETRAKRIAGALAMLAAGTRDRNSKYR